MLGVRDHERNSPALSVAQSISVRAGIPVISATEEVTCAGWPIAAAQALSSIFTAGTGPPIRHTRRPPPFVNRPDCLPRRVTLLDNDRLPIYVHPSRHREPTP